MEDPIVLLSSYWWVLPIVALFAAVIFGYSYIFRLFGVVIIPDDAIGQVVKKFVLFGTNKELPPGKIIALMGEAGAQADTLAPGLHFGFWPWQYSVEIKNFIIIPPGKIGVVESRDGKALPDGRILGREVQCDNFQDARAFLTNGGERGAQMAIIPPGSWRINSNVFSIRIGDMTIIPKGKIGVVEAKDGKPLSGGRVLGGYVDCDSFQNAQSFMDNGGERGPQMRIVPEGTYRINPLLFNVTLESVTDIPDNMIGVITTKEGASLATGEIAGKEVAGHEMFQNPQSFVNNGGFKGLQEQVLLAGRYFLNPLFVTVEQHEMTKVPIAHVGVVIAYVGSEGKDVTGETFEHGNLVSRGEKGVWVSSLDPGKYPINPHTHKVELVPTANVVLNWANEKSESHMLDERLSTITVRSSDGFTFNLDVSQIIHIPSIDAPKVIARFGSVANLVTQVLEPTIGNYFRRAAQSSDVILFLRERGARQDEAKEAIAAALRHYNVGAVDTLIGDIVPPESLMRTLTDRKIAEQEQITYGTQRLAQDARKELAQAQAMADTQPGVVAAERKVTIAGFDKTTAITKAEGEGEAAKITARAQAEAAVATGRAQAEVTTLTGTAEAGRTLAIGKAEAEVIEQKTKAMDKDQFALVEVARAIAGSQQKLVPEILANGGGDNGTGGGSLVNILLAQLVAKNMTKES